MLVSCGEVRSKSVTLHGHMIGGMGRSLEYTPEVEAYMVFYIIGYAWILETCNAVSHFVVSYAVCLWYYSKWDDRTGDKQRPWFAVLRGFFNGMTFHFGSLTLGALLITALKVLRVFLLIATRAMKAKDNKVAECIAASCLCCVSLLENGVSFVSRNAYIDVAINSKHYCKAARESFEFLSKNAATIAMQNGATFLLQVFGCSAVSVGGGFATYYAVTTQDRFTNDLSDHYVADPQFVAGIAALMCLSVASVFLDVVDQSAETLLFVYATSVQNGTWWQHVSDSLRAAVGEPNDLKDNVRQLTQASTAAAAAVTALEAGQAKQSYFRLFSE